MVPNDMPLVLARRCRMDEPNRGYLHTVATRFLRHRLGVISLYFVATLTLLALLAPLISPYDPNKLVGKFSAPPSAQFWLGTDQVGRDVLTRLLHATRVSLLVGFASTAIATAIGVVLGLLSGYFGGWVDMAIMRFTDMVMLIEDDSQTDSAILVILYDGYFIQMSVWNSNYSELDATDMTTATDLLDSLSIVPAN